MLHPYQSSVPPWAGSPVAQSSCQTPPRRAPGCSGVELSPGPLPTPADLQWTMKGSDTSF